MLQATLTEARVAAERALAAVMQQHAATTRLEEWAGQIVTVGDSWWYGGVALSPVNGSTSSVSMDVQGVQPGVKLIVVSSAH